jgi:hypothetical protein
MRSVIETKPSQAKTRQAKPSWLRMFATIIEQLPYAFPVLTRIQSTGFAAVSVV